MFPTHVSLVGTQLNTFLTTPTLPVHGSTRHAVETHLLNSAVTLCILWHLTVSQKLHQLNSGVPYTCLTSADSAKHFSNHPYPSCTRLNKVCTGHTFAPFCSHSMHSVTLDSVPDITNIHQGCSSHMSH